MQDQFYTGSLRLRWCQLISTVAVSELLFRVNFPLHLGFLYVHRWDASIQKLIASLNSKQQRYVNQWRSDWEEHMYTIKSNRGNLIPTKAAGNWGLHIIVCGSLLDYWNTSFESPVRNLLECCSLCCTTCQQQNAIKQKCLVIWRGKRGEMLRRALLFR